MIAFAIITERVHTENVNVTVGGGDQPVNKRDVLALDRVVPNMAIAMKRTNSATAIDIGKVMDATYRTAQEILMTATTEAIVT